MLLEEVRKESGGDSLEVNWRHFSLEQQNTKEGPEWKVWEQPVDVTRSMLAARACEAARLQGNALFEAFHIALLRARHEDRSDIRQRAVLFEVAGSVGLELERFGTDLDNESLKDIVRDDHTEAVERYGIFGTPTFVFPNGGAAYLKMVKAPDGQATRTLETVVDMMRNRLYVGEVKRPQPPWPKGSQA